MAKLLRETVRCGGQDTEILIEVGDFALGGEASDLYGPTRESTLVTKAFDKAMTLIRACAEQVVETIHAVAKSARPNEVEVEFGVKMEGETGIAFLAKSGVEAQLQVKLKWVDPKEK